MLDQSLAAVLKLNAVSSANVKIMCIIYSGVCVSLAIQNCPTRAMDDYKKKMFYLLFSTGTVVMTPLQQIEQ